MEFESHIHKKCGQMQKMTTSFQCLPPQGMASLPPQLHKTEREESPDTSLSCSPLFTKHCPFSLLENFSVLPPTPLFLRCPLPQPATTPSLGPCSSLQIISSHLLLPPSNLFSILQTKWSFTNTVLIMYFLS